MNWLEAVAAALVGLALLLLVLGPLLSGEAVPAVVDDEPVDFEETPKGIALSALKEIEFDLATGKLSDEDYALLKGKYTALALHEMRAEDGGSFDMEDAIAARARIVRGQPAAGPVCTTCGPRPEPDAEFCSSCGIAIAA